MSRKLVTLFLSMVVLAGAMGLKAAVVGKGDGSAIMGNGPAPTPRPPWK